ncbi:MAG: YihY/virulence factor BrkB family protein [Candidatus Aquicultorales bacterium]
MQLILYILRLAGKRFFRDGGFFLAAAVAFFGSISVFPLLMLGFALLLLFVRAGAASPLILAIADSLVPNGARFLGDLIQNEAGAANAGMIGIAVLLYAGMAVFGALQYALNRILKCTKCKRPYWRFLLTALTMAAVAGGIIVLSSFLRIGIGLLREAISPGFPLLSAILTFLSAAVTLAIAFVIVTVIFLYVPSDRMSLQQVLPGTIFTSVAIIIGQAIFAAVLNRTTLPFIFGSLTAIIALLIWIDITAILVILGAEIVGVWRDLLNVRADNQGRDKKRAA